MVEWRYVVELETTPLTSRKRPPPRAFFKWVKSPQCPLDATDDRFDEAHYFLNQAAANYHSPQRFRWYLNATIQALRSVTFVLQKNLARVPGGKTWYENHRKELEEDPNARRLVTARNVVVKEGDLAKKSTVQAGLYRGTVAKFVFAWEIPTSLPSESVLQFAIENFPDFIKAEGHTAIDEQLGVERTWMVEVMGDQEVLGVCDHVLSAVGRLVRDAHLLVKRRRPFPDSHEHDFTRDRVFLETDMDPTLPKRWGWENEEWVFHPRLARSVRKAHLGSLPPIPKEKPARRRTWTSREKRAGRSGRRSRGRNRPVKSRFEGGG